MCNHMKHTKSTLLCVCKIWRHRLYAEMNETDFFYYKIYWLKGILGLKYQFIFIFILNKFRFNLYLLRKSHFLFQNV